MMTRFEPSGSVGLGRPPGLGGAARAALFWSVACGPVVGVLLVTAHSVWGAMFVYHVGCLVLASSLSSMGPLPGFVRLLGVAASTAAVVVCAGLALVAVLPETHLPMSRWQAWGLAPPQDSWILVYYVCVNPWVEEWFWRGGLLGGQGRSGFGRRVRVGLSVVAFGVFHVFVLLPAYGIVVGGIASALVASAGAGWTLLRLRSGTVWWSAASHFGANFGLAILYFARLR